MNVIVALDFEQDSDRPLTKQEIADSVAQAVRNAVQASTGKRR